MRRSAGPDFGSPPPTAPVGGGGYFPHDLDDIYESQTDHQYFTHTGASGPQQQRPTAISIFHRVSAAHTSLDDYTLPGDASRQSMNSTDSGVSSGPFNRQRFDNSSFAKSLSIDEQDPQHSPHKEGHSKHGKHHHHHSHHHHSIHELVKHFGKKMHLWPRKHHDAQSVCTSPQNDPQENFRTRSKSLDVNTLSRPNRILDDCGATYKIYDRIVKEGKGFRAGCFPFGTCCSIRSSLTTLILYSSTCTYGNLLYSFRCSHASCLCGFGETSCISWCRRSRTARGWYFGSTPCSHPLQRLTRGKFKTCS